MNTIMTIAECSWKAVLKMKVVYFLVFCVWMLVGIMVRYNELSLDRHRELMLDMSLLLNQIAAILIVLSVTFEIPKEIREGVASTYLTKSLGRMQYLIGKCIGVWVTSFVICLLIAVGSYAIYRCFFDVSIFRSYCLVQFMLILSVIPMAPIGIFCAVVLPEMAAPIIALLLMWFSTITGQLHVPVLSGGILPNLDFFNLKEHVIYFSRVPVDYILLAAVWGCAFAVFLLMLSSIIFRFKDIK